MASLHIDKKKRESKFRLTKTINGWQSKVSVYQYVWIFMRHFSKDALKCIEKERSVSIQHVNDGNTVLVSLLGKDKNNIALAEDKFLMFHENTRKGVRINLVQCKTDLPSSIDAILSDICTNFLDCIIVTDDGSDSFVIVGPRQTIGRATRAAVERVSQLNKDMGRKEKHVVIIELNSDGSRVSHVGTEDQEPPVCYSQHGVTRVDLTGPQFADQGSRLPDNSEQFAQPASADKSTRLKSPEITSVQHKSGGIPIRFTINASNRDNHQTIHSAERDTTHRPVSYATHDTTDDFAQRSAPTAIHLGGHDTPEVVAPSVNHSPSPNDAAGISYRLPPGSVSYTGYYDASSTKQHGEETSLKPKRIHPMQNAAVYTPNSNTIADPRPHIQQNPPGAGNGTTEIDGHYATCGTTNGFAQRSAQNTTHSTAEIVAPSVHHIPSPGAADDLPDQCPVCMESVKDPMTLKCGHTFCEECITAWFSDKPVCPVCGRAYGVITGNQPEGEMQVNQVTNRLPGFEDTSEGTIIIQYIFPSGIQQDCHPNPGRPYKGIQRQAYLPDNTEGREVLALLRKAFDARLTFTIGRSVTTGLDDQITWNDIHHKTSVHGGPTKYGYPDDNYLSKVKEELASKGIKGK